MADLCAMLAADEETGAVGLFLETVRRPPALASALELLAEAGKPVVCLKVGRSPAGARVALAHTGALVGSAQAFSALLRRFGAIEVEDFPELVETLELGGAARHEVGLIRVRVTATKSIRRFCRHRLAESHHGRNWRGRSPGTLSPRQSPQAWPGARPALAPRAVAERRPLPPCLRCGSVRD